MGDAPSDATRWLLSGARSFSKKSIQERASWFDLNTSLLVLQDRSVVLNGENACRPHPERVCQ